jgi:Subtilase family
MPFGALMRKLFAVCLLATTASANEVSYRSLQSGSPTGPTPIHDRGIHGEGQIVAVVDTGLDYNSCYFAEPDGTPPPFNTGSPAAGLHWQNVDLARRKVVAYNFLYSCDQYPNALGCDRPGTAGSLDNQGHGTHAAGAIAGDRGTPILHDLHDAIAPGAKLIIQDAGFLPTGDTCAQLPGLRCPLDLTRVFEQAYKQGARIHSNSWGDRQGATASQNPPRANYPQSARDVDAFVWSHPDSLVLFNTGNILSGLSPQKSLSAPGAAKNTIQVGGTRGDGNDDDVISAITLFGPTVDGRIKPDLVGPASVRGPDIDFDQNPNTCDVTRQPGTSWSSPTIAGAAALVRQYYTDGFYPGGAKSAANALIPSAALMKATLIAAARPAPWRRQGFDDVRALPAPSYEQGWGFPVLDDALFFAGDTRKLRVVDVPLANGLAAGASSTVRVRVNAGTPFKAVLVWTDPPGTVRGMSDTTPQLVNDLDLRVSGVETTPDRLNNVEVVSIAEPAAGTYEVTVSAHRLGFGPRQSYALVITGDVEDAAMRRRAARH